jgi:tripartite-type tricarboxylate transporter receptor subunit TctC
MAEAGLGAFNSRPWWGLVVPAGTPQPIVARLNTEFTRLFREPRFVEFLESRFTEPVPGTAEEFSAFLKADREAAAALVKLAKR